MKKFIQNTIFFLVASFVIIILLVKTTSIIVKNRQFENYETESNLLIFKENKNYDFMFMGISHARNFSRHRNHLRVENILNKKFINIGQGGGTCGVNEQLYYLNYFYKKNNSVNTIVYILSPPMLFSETLPQAANTFDNETIEFDFLFNYFFFKTENKYERLWSYLKTKITITWIFYKPNSLDSKNESLIEINMDEVKKGFGFTYKNGLNENVYNNSCETLENTIKLAIKNNSEIILIIPPALFGKWYGHNETVEFANKMQDKYNVDFYDYSETVLKPEYYYDHHHLNTKGIIFFTKNYLSKMNLIK